MRFSEAMDSFIQFSRVHHSVGTQDYYKSKTKYLLDFFGKIDVNKINRELIFEFVHKHRNRNSNVTNATLNKYIAALLFILKNECEIHLQFRKLQEIERITPTIPQNIISLIFRHYQSLEHTPVNVRNHLIFILLLDTGLRINELLNLNISDIDFDTSSIYVKITKSNQERFTFFKADTHLMLNNYINIAKIDNKLFIDFRSKKTLTVNSIETICVRLKNTLNINMSISPHKWRHTFATKFQKENNDLEVLRLILRHKKISTTQKYLHLDRQHLHDIYFSKN